MLHNNYQRSQACLKVCYRLQNGGLFMSIACIFTELHLHEPSAISSASITVILPLFQAELRRMLHNINHRSLAQFCACYHSTKWRYFHVNSIPIDRATSILGVLTFVSGVFETLCAAAAFAGTLRLTLLSVFSPQSRRECRAYGEKAEYWNILVQSVSSAADAGPTLLKQIPLSGST